MTKQQRAYAVLARYHLRVEYGHDDQTGKRFEVVRAGSPVQPGSPFDKLWRIYLVCQN